MRRVPALFAALLSTLSVGLLHAAEDKGGIEFFENKIRPVLVKHCYHCHSAAALKEKKLQGGLLLDTRAGIRAGGDSGPAVVPDKPDESLLISSLKQEDFEMPPEGKLPDAVIADFVKWVEMGAPDPREGGVKLTKPAPVEKADHWAFHPPKATAPPAVRRRDWPRQPIDNFILARMEANNLNPVGLAEPRVLVRRIYFDLIGLPPTPEQVDQFVSAAEQNRQQAVISLVDELLRSPHYGERWGRHWLDVARYAEDQAHTFGVKRRENAHQYRDWVIRAFNDDMPFKQFIRLQLAGDLMDHPDRFTRFAGLGFLGLGAQYYKNSDKAQALADELDDAVDTLTRGFLGLTVSCARCHDHKFDPVSSADYYALAGIFNGRSYSEAPLVDDATVEVYRKAQKRVDDKNNEIRDWLKETGVRTGKSRFPEIARYFVAAWRMSVLKSQDIKFKEEDVAEQEKLHPYYIRRFREFVANEGEAVKRFPELKPWYEETTKQDGVTAYDQTRVPETISRLAAELQKSAEEALQRDEQLDREHARALAAAADDNERKKIKRPQLDKDQQRILRNFLTDGRGPLFANEGEVERRFLAEAGKQQLTAMRDEVKKLQALTPPKYPVAHVIRGGGKTMPIYIRGNPANPGPLVAKSFLQVFSDTPRPTEPEEAKNHAYNRLDLAGDIASDENPLTARVIVNRVWQWHFGRGLVRSASNFGMAGEAPSHPQLLDDLTLRFVENGWSLKWLHRQIMTSTTYQLSSRIDPGNIDIDAGNQYLWRFPRRRLDVESWRDALLAVSGKLDRTPGGPTFELKNNSTRRTVYAKISRHELDGLLRLFDFPDANVSAAKRTETTVPQQQLFVLNSPFFIEQAKAFSRRVNDAADDDAGRIQAAYRLAFGRNPTEEELDVAKQFLAVEHDKQDRLSRWEQLAQALLATNEFLYID